MKQLPSPYFCLAPWVHTYISPSGKRGLCCVSKDTSQSGLSKTSFKEFWNGHYMRSIRRRMLQQEALPECHPCYHGPAKRYRDHFNSSFSDLLETALLKTDSDGKTDLEPISLDYRLSNLCNFKCRTCGPEFSSAWEKEESPEHLTKNSQQNLLPELQKLVRSEKVREIYWAGGEPLLNPTHWSEMKFLIESGQSKNISLRYNTNLSFIEWQGVHLFRDLLPHFRESRVSASIDAAGAIGEYIRTGLKWGHFLKNFSEGLKYTSPTLSLTMDVTLTLPGLIGLKELLKTAETLGSSVIFKLASVGVNNCLLSPLILSRACLSAVIETLIKDIESSALKSKTSLISALRHIQSLPTFEEALGEQWSPMIIMRSWHILKELERKRGDHKEGRLTIEQILNQHPVIKDWWATTISSENYDLQN